MAADEPQGTHGGSWRESYRDRRYAVLLVILLALLGGPPVLLGFGLPSGWFDVLMTLLMLATIQSLCFDRRQRLFALALGIPTILLSLGGQTISGVSGEWVLFVGHLCEVLFLFGAAGLIVQSLVSASTLHFDSILGAVCGYLFLGLAWAVFYSMIESSVPGSFRISQSLGTLRESPGLLPNLLTYYSFVTLTTVGYGDVTPISPAARTLAWIEAVTGQFYLAVIVAGLVSMLVAKTSRFR